MKLAMIGLGKMGANMTSRLLRGGNNVVAFDLNEEAIQKAESEGAEGAGLCPKSPRNYLRRVWFG